MMGRRPFTKVAVESTIDNMEQAVGQSIPEDARQWLGMLGFKIVIDEQGTVPTFGQMPGRWHRRGRRRGKTRAPGQIPAPSSFQFSPLNVYVARALFSATRARHWRPRQHFLNCRQAAARRRFPAPAAATPAPRDRRRRWAAASAQPWPGRDARCRRCGYRRRHSCPGGYRQLSATWPVSSSSSRSRRPAVPRRLRYSRLLRPGSARNGIFRLAKADEVLILGYRHDVDIVQG